MGAVDHVRWRSRPSLDRPVLVAAFEGWNDAGDAASGAVRYLIDRYDAELVAEIDPEEFFDFTSTPPAGRDRRRRGPPASCGRPPRSTPPACPATAATCCCSSAPSRSSGGARSAPRSPAWPQELGCRLVVTLGALVAEVPHSRPVPVVGTVDRPRPRVRARAAAVDLPGPDRRRRRAVGRLPRGRPRRRRRCGPRCPPTCPRPRRPRRCWRCSSTPPRCSACGCRPPTSRSRRRPTSARSPSWSRRTTRRPTTSPSSRSATTPTTHDGTAGRSLVEEVERFLRDRPD